jgi:hypothetical protein
MRLIFVFWLICMVSQPVSAQGISGEIINSREADELFGAPEKSFKIEISHFEKSAESSDYIYFNFDGEFPIVTNQKKEVIFSEEYRQTGDEVFQVYSSSILQELINKSQSDFLLIEKRKNVLTITGGSYTLEYGMLCPPNCY